MKKIHDDVQFDLEHEEMRMLESLLNRMCINGQATMEPQTFEMQLKFEALHEKFGMALMLLDRKDN